jgi:hypothetical protein
LVIFSVKLNAISNEGDELFTKQIGIVFFNQMHEILNGSQGATELSKVFIGLEGGYNLDKGFHIVDTLIVLAVVVVELGFDDFGSLRGAVLGISLLPPKDLIFDNIRKIIEKHLLMDNLGKVLDPDCESNIIRELLTNLVVWLTATNIVTMDDENQFRFISLFCHFQNCLAHLFEKL